MYSSFPLKKLKSLYYVYVTLFGYRQGDLS